MDHRHATLWLANLLICLVDTRAHCVAQAGRELLSSRDPPTLASQDAETTGLSHLMWPKVSSLKREFRGQRERDFSASLEEISYHAVREATRMSMARNFIDPQRTNADQG